VGLAIVRSPVLMLMGVRVRRSMMEDFGSVYSVTSGRDMAREICWLVTIMAK
jgi:hypothetical protein